MEAYEKVSQHELYNDLNQALLDLVCMPPVASAIDLGCGSGSLSRIMLQRRPGLKLWAIDPDEAMTASVARGLGTEIGVLQAGAEDFAVAFPPGAVDLVAMGNAIHLVGDVDLAVRQVAQVLRPGGVFAFNTAFHVDAAAAGEDRIARSLLFEAYKQARRLAPPEARGVGVRPLAKRPLDEAFYRKVLADAGFTLKQVQRRVVSLPPALVAKIVATPVFAAGALSWIAPDVSGQILAQALEAVLADLDSQQLPNIERTWLYFCAIKEA